MKASVTVFSAFLFLTSFFSGIALSANHGRLTQNVIEREKTPAICNEIQYSDSAVKSFLAADLQGRDFHTPPGKLTITGSFTTSDKVYDGNTSATIVSDTFSLLGIDKDENVYLDVVTATFTQADAGYLIEVTITGASLAGDLSDQYEVVLNDAPTSQASIHSAALTVRVTGNPTKVYDGEPEVELSAGDYTLAGLVEGEVVTISATTGSFDDHHAGTHTVTVELAPEHYIPGTGFNPDNYVLDTLATGSGLIALRAITITGTFTAKDKLYDETTTAEFLEKNLELKQLVTNDDVTLANVILTFEQSSIANNVTVLINSAAIQGQQSHNYELITDNWPTALASIYGEVFLNQNSSGAGSVGGAGYYYFDDELIITAKPNHGYSFLHWEDASGVVVSLEGDYVFRMPDEMIAYSAIFVIDLQPEASYEKICRGVSVDLQAHAFAASGLFYDWYVGNESIFSGFDFTVKPEVTTRFTVKATDNEISRESEILIDVYEDFTVPEPKHIVMKTLNEVPVVLIYPQPGLIYEWHFNGSPLEDEIQQHYYPDSAFGQEHMGIYKVRLDDHSSPPDYECRVFSYPLEITTDNLLSYPFDRDDLFLFYPNPASQMINLVINEVSAGTLYGNIQIRMYNQFGQTLLSKNIRQWHTSLSVEEIKPGIYFIEVVFNNKYRQVRRLIIDK